MFQPRTLSRILVAALAMGFAASAAGCQGGWLPGVGQLFRSELTPVRMEEAVRGYFPGSRIDSLQIERSTLREANETGGFNWDDGRVSSASPVYVATVRGRLMPNFMSGRRFPDAIGASEPWTEEVVMLLDAYDAQVLSARGKPFQQENPGFRVTPEAKAIWHLGDRFTFTTGGEAPAGALTLTLTNRATGEKRRQEIPYREAAGFALPLDAEHLPGYQDVPIQTFELLVELPDGRHQRKTGGELKVLKEAGVLAPPASVAMGSDGPGGPPITAAELEAFARLVAGTEWKGQALTMTTQTVTLSSLEPPARLPHEVPAATTLHQFDFEGTFPRYYLPAHLSGTGQEAVMTPHKLRVVLTETRPVHVVQAVAFE